VAPSIRIKRVYEPAGDRDGYRVLVDRLWPRGISKADAALDAWPKDLAPSPELRRWFGHKPERFDQFREHYRQELAEHREAAAELLKVAGDQPITLLYAARDPDHNHAVVLSEYLHEIAHRERRG